MKLKRFDLLSIVIVVVLTSCKNKNKYDYLKDADNSVVEAATTADTITKGKQVKEIELSKEIKEVFDAWLQDEIKKGDLLEECPGEYGSKEWQKFNENHKSKNVNIGGKIVESNRWAFFGLSKVLYFDFNNDGKKDALIVGDLGQDCLAGNGYTGDPEVTILIVSKADNYIVDNTFLDKFYKNVNNSDANKYKKESLAYVIVDDIKNGSILGKYESWSSSENVGTNFSQFRGKFSYDIAKNATTISNEEKIKYTK